MRARRSVAFVALLWLLASPVAAFAQSATLSIPAGISFSVPNVTQSAGGSPDPFRVVFSTTGVKGSQDLYVSVKADSANFAGPGTTRIPASKVSWTSTPVGRGSGSGGTLSSAAYAAMFESRPRLVDRTFADFTVDGPGYMLEDPLARE